jgi:hypothetical protein
MDESSLARTVATAVLGIDTLWGGDVMCPSGTGRFVADTWFSGEPLPPAYSHPTAEAVRKGGGVSAKEPDRAAIDASLEKVNVRGAIGGISRIADLAGGLRGGFLAGQAACLQVMWDLVQERLGRGAPVPYERCVRTLTGADPERSRPEEKRARLTELLEAAGYPARSDLLAAASAWRAERAVPRKTLPAVGSAFIAQLDALAEKNLCPHLPPELRGVPRANTRFLPIADAWFSGSMNYLGRARRPDGSPEYEATYEINAALEIAVPEFLDLVAHEVVPGHVTTFAFLQRLFTLGKVGFEATVLTMNTRAAALYEGIANNAVLIAHGVTDLADLPDPDLQIGTLLMLLQDDAKNQASYLTYKESVPREEIQTELRRDYLVSAERADKLSGAWAQHPLLGRMYLPAYRFGTELVARLRRQHDAKTLLPILYGAGGVVDTATILDALA